MPGGKQDNAPGGKQDNVPGGKQDNAIEVCTSFQSDFDKFAKKVLYKLKGNEVDTELNTKPCSLQVDTELNTTYRWIRSSTPLTGGYRAHYHYDAWHD